MRGRLKPYVRSGALDGVTWPQRLLGLCIGLPMSAAGCLAFWSRDPFGVLFLGACGLLGGPILLGAIGTSQLRYAQGALTIRYVVLGGLPLFTRTLVRPGEATGLKHIRRVGGYQNAEGERLDEHFLVLASHHRHEHVLEDLGRHPPSQAAALARLAQVRARAHSLTLVHLDDG